MKEKPTTFQLAQLAATVPPPTQPKDAVKRAWEIWHEAETEIAEHDSRGEFLRNLFWTHDGKNIPLFTDSPKDWQARIKSYPGDQRDVHRAMWNREFSNEEVQKQLFRDKTLSLDTRRRLLLKLAKASGFILSGHAFRHGDVSIEYGTSQEHWKFDSGFLRGLGDFDLHAICDGLRSSVGVNNFAKR